MLVGWEADRTGAGLALQNIKARFMNPPRYQAVVMSSVSGR